MAEVKMGGYQSGKSYEWYREMGHGPIGAVWMAIPFWGAILVSVIAGLGLAWLTK